MSSTGLGRRLALGGGAAAIAATAWGALVERKWYAVRHQELAVLPGRGRLRVLFFADLHYAPWEPHRLDFVRRAIEEYLPDLIISGGDNLETPDAIEPVIDLHRQALASGVPGLAVLGAHDRFAARLGNPASYLFGPSNGPGGKLLDTERLVAGMTDAGWQVLCNDDTVVETAVGPLHVVGLDDPHIDRDDLSVVPAQADPDAALRLGLVHAPYLRALHAFADAGFDLALAGHTHGGQLAVPGWGALVSNCDLPPRQAKGTSTVQTPTSDLRLHVSAGMGHSIYYPIRFACRPELTVLDLTGPST